MTLLQSNDLQHSDETTQLDQMLRGGGEMGALIRALDWSATPLGSIEAWPQSLRTAVSICLFSRFPIHIWWGPQFVELYNDAYRPILGSTKHPASLGKPGAVTSAEIWHIIGPMLRNVYENAVSTWSDNLMLPMDRYGFTEETYFTLSYSPVFVETGKVGGVFTVVTETTRQVLGERRLRTLHRLSERTSDAKTAEDACRLAGETLSENRADIPFSLIYLLDESETAARLVASSGIDADSDINPSVVELTSIAACPWQLTDVLTTGQGFYLTRLDKRFAALMPSPWEERPHTALVLPIRSGGGDKITGVFIGGASARLSLDEDYQHFYELIASHIATAVANARTYEQERKRAEALAELDRAKTEFFSNISHEFRTPLTLMLNPLQEVLEGAHGLPPEQRENLDVAYRNSLRLQKLVNTLLDFSRIQSNRIRAYFEPIELGALTADLASNFRSVVERAGLRLTIDCPPLAEPVYVDREMWEKIVLNLLSNAFKFTFEGEIAVSVCNSGDTVELTVRDTGIGISDADLTHIFERFHRVHGARSRTYEGSGIGLALVSELVHFHGGHIAAASRPGIGTTFTVTLPLGFAHLPADQLSVRPALASTAVGVEAYIEEAWRWQPDETQQHAAFESAVLNDDSVEHVGAPLPEHFTKTVLVIDDNTDMRSYLVRLLQPRYQVITASDGLSALTLMEQHLPDLVLADVMMPGLDGFGLLQRLRSNAQTRLLPVLLLSARAGEEARIEGLQAGANDYLTKPFSARELLARVDGQLQLAQLRRETQTAIESIIEGIADPFYALDHEWRFVYVNQRAQQVWNKTRAEMIGRTLWDAFPDRNFELDEHLLRAAEEQRPASFEMFAASLNQWLEINVYPSRIGLAVYFRDITARHTAFEAEQQARREAEDANALKLKFLGMVSHELRTPLASIKGFSSTLLASDVSFAPQQQMEFVRVIDEETDKLTGLVEQLLDLSRLQSGKLRFEPKPLTLKEILDSAMAQLTTLTVDHELVLHVPDVLPQIHADCHRIAQVLANLVGNAVKFSPVESPITIRASAANGHLQVDVSDHGEGIPPEEREKVFEAFHQIEPNDRRQRGGVGLGLAICKHIVDAHGGVIWIQDRDVGTTISFALPALRAAPLT